MMPDTIERPPSAAPEGYLEHSSVTERVDKLMREPVPEKLLEAVNDVTEQMQEELAQVQSGPLAQSMSPFLKQFFADPEKGNHLGRVMYELQKREKTINDQIDTMAAEGIHSGRRFVKDEKGREVSEQEGPRTDTMDSMRALAELVRGIEKSEKAQQTLDEAVDVETRRVLAGSLEGVVLAQQLDNIAEISTPNPQFARRVVEKLERVSTDERVPKSLRQRLQRSADEHRSATAEKEPEGPAFDRTVEKPFFGKESMPDADLKSFGAELKEQYERGEYAAVAKQLAHLKRAGIELKGPMREKFFAKCQGATADMSDKPDDLASFLTHLKYIGAIKQPSADQQTLLQTALEAKLAQNGVDGLSQFCVNARYLGVKLKTDELRPYLQMEYKRLRQQPNSEGKVVRHLARLKHLGLEYAVGDRGAVGGAAIVSEGQAETSGQATLDRLGVTERLSALRSAGKWRQYVRLRIAADLLRGPSQVDPQDQTEIMKSLQTQVSRAREFMNWMPYTIYAGDIATVSKMNQDSKRQSADLTKEAYGQQVVQWLEEGTPPRPEVPPRKWEQRTTKPEARRQPNASQSKPGPTFAEQFPQRAAYQTKVEQHYREIGAEPTAPKTAAQRAKSEKRSWWRRLLRI